MSSIIIITCTANTTRQPSRRRTTRKRLSWDLTMIASTTHLTLYRNSAHRGSPAANQCAAVGRILWHARHKIAAGTRGHYQGIATHGESHRQTSLPWMSQKKRRLLCSDVPELGNPKMVRIVEGRPHDRDPERGSTCLRNRDYEGGRVTSIFALGGVYVSLLSTHSHCTAFILPAFHGVVYILPSLDGIHFLFEHLHPFLQTAQRQRHFNPRYLIS